MNAYQRVMHTLGGLPVDRTPVFAVLGAWGGKLTQTDLRTLYSDADAYLAGQIAVQEEFAFDLVMPPFDFSAIAEAFGGETAWSDRQAPNVRRPAARSVAEALTLPLPDPLATGRLPVALAATRKLASLYHERVPVIAVLPGPGVLPSLLVGMEKWLEAVLFDRDRARQLMERTDGFFVSWANALLEAGADCLVVTEGMASAEIAPRALFAKEFLPHLTSTFARIPGAKVLHHTGGRLNQNIDLFPGLPGLVGIAVSSKDDLAESRRLIGPGLTLIGNLDNLTLPAISADELFALSLSRLRAAGADGHFILCNSAADVPLDTPPENLRAMLAAAAAYASETGGAR